MDFQTFYIEKPAVLFVAPGHVHQILKIKDLKGYSITFDKACIQKAMEGDLKKVSNVPIVIEFNELTKPLFSLADLLLELQQVPSNAFVKRASQGILHSFLNLIASRSISGPPSIPPKNRRAGVIVHAFLVLLENNYKTWKEPSQYAAELSISTSHLNDVVKASTGKSVTTHIHSQSILEAKRLLNFTDLTVKQICYETGFKHAIYFNKVFKKMTGMTPLGFRNKFRV